MGSSFVTLKRDYGGQAEGIAAKRRKRHKNLEAGIDWSYFVTEVTEETQSSRSAVFFTQEGAEISRGLTLQFLATKRRKRHKKLTHWSYSLVPRAVRQIAVWQRGYGRKEAQNQHGAMSL